MGVESKGTPDTLETITAKLESLRDIEEGARWEKVPLNSLIPDAKNARIHSDRNIEVVMQSLTEFGQYSPLIVQKSTNKILVGNARHIAMIRLGWQNADVHFVDVDDITAARLAIADNRSSDFARWDNLTLASLFREIQQGDYDAEVGLPGFTGGEIEAICAAVEKVTVIIPEPNPPKAKKICPHCGMEIA